MEERGGKGIPTQAEAPLPVPSYGWLSWGTGKGDRQPRAAQGTVSTTPAPSCSLSVPLSVGQQEGQALEMELKICT